MRFQIDKNIIKNKFIDSIKTYDKNAIVQKKMAKELLDFVLQFSGNKFNHILEIGSGTGLLTKEIVDSIEFKKLITNDLSSDYKSIIRGIISNLNIDYKFIEGDAEFSLEFPENNDLVISNATFQWFNNLNEFIIKSIKLLNNNGILAFTTFGENNFNEISSISNSGLEYISLEKILENTQDKFELLHTHTYEEKLFFKTPIDVLKHMKKTGVNATNNNNSIIKPKEFAHNYIKNFSQDTGVYITYNPMFVVLKKK